MASIRQKGGFVSTVEILFIATLVVLGVAIAFPLIRNALIAELEDSSEAIGALDQAYWITGGDVIGITISSVSGSHEGTSFADSIDTTQGPGDSAKSYDLLLAPDFSEAGLFGSEFVIPQGP